MYSMGKVNVVNLQLEFDGDRIERVGPCKTRHGVDCRDKQLHAWKVYHYR